MSAITSEITLWLFVINLGVAFGAGLYEHRIVLPRWITSQASGRWNAEAALLDDTGRRFWGFVTTVPLTLLTVANLFVAWRLRVRFGLVARGWTCRIGRPGVHVLVFHSNDDRADGKGELGGVRGSRDTVVESQLPAPPDRPDRLAGLTEGVRPVLSAVRIVSLRVNVVDETVVQCEYCELEAREDTQLVENRRQVALDGLVAD